MESFLCDAKPWLKLDVVPITDVFGPTAWDRDLEGLVVSHETARGGEVINKEREGKVREGRGGEGGRERTYLHSLQGLKPISVHIVDLIDRSQDSTLAQEQKLSSSDIRRTMLGSFREAEVCMCVCVCCVYICVCI